MQFLDRRAFVGAFGAALFTTRGLFADLIATPRLTEGPFYPDRLPLDRDNDLIIVGDSTTPAVGEITHLSGRVLDSKGDPLRDLTVEIWQCDSNGVYLHSLDRLVRESRRDRNFQGFGRFVTGSTGEYRFRTIKPVMYVGRSAPHIHVKVKRGDQELLTTQLFIRGNPGNERDRIFLDTGDAATRELVLVDFKPIAGSKIGELSANFDIVLGRTPHERS
ncbi:MAG TPA: protocatechuate 3,4-dioxygenase [Pirellulales bacterium]|nr:protocatechuate 3,4-dioxygenase [Pirellulales bacterium]